MIGHMDIMKKTGTNKLNNGFCEQIFRSMFLSGTFTKAVMYIMLLCDSIIAGYFIGESGVAAINAITPVTGIVTFLETSFLQVSELSLQEKLEQ